MANTGSSAEEGKSCFIVAFCLPGGISGVIQRVAICPTFLGTKLARGMLQLRTQSRHFLQPVSTRWRARMPAGSTTQATAGSHLGAVLEAARRLPGCIRHLKWCLVRQHEFQRLIGHSGGEEEIFSQF